MEFKKSGLLFISLLLLFSGRKKDSIEREQINGFIIEKNFKNNSMASSKSINEKTNIPEYECIYNKPGMSLK